MKGSQGRKLEAGTEADYTGLLLTHLACLYHLELFPQDSSTLSGLGPPTLIMTQENATQICTQVNPIVEIPSNIGDSSLCQGDKKLASTLTVIFFLSQDLIV